MGKVSCRSLLVASLCVALVANNVLGQAAELPTLGSDIGLSLSKVLSSSGPQTMSLSAPFLFGINNAQNNQGQSQSMIVDLSFNQIFVPDATRSSFGFTCSQAMQCESVGQQAALPSYGGLTPQGTQASTFLRFTSNTVAGATMPTSLNFYLATLNSDWTSKFQQNGVFGLGSASPVWSFLKSSYSFPNGYLDVSFHLEVKDSSEIYELDKVAYSSSSKLTITDSGDSDSVFGAKQTYQAGAAWALAGSTIRFSKSFTTAKSQICVDSSSQSFFLISAKYYSQVIQTVNQQLCGSSTGCTKSNTRVADIDNIVLTVPGADGTSSYTLTLLGKDFVNFDSDENTVVGISQLEQSQVCAGQQFDFGVGRLLLNKVQVTIRMLSSKQNEFQIGVADSSNAGKKEWEQVLIMSAGSLVLSSLVTLYLVKKFLRPQGETDVEEPLNN